jgi:hypothetical protein
MLTIFVEKDGYGIRTQKDPKTRKQFTYFNGLGPTEQIPRRAAPFVGDAVHNLRSSLDLVYVEIVRSAGGKTTRHTTFPFRHTRQELEAACNGGSIKLASGAVISAIIDEIKPYRSGNDPLYDLHDLDILNKHLGIIPILAEIQFQDVAMRFGLKHIESFGFMPTCDIVVATESRIDTPAGRIQPKGYRNPPFQILFGPGSFEYRSVIPTLHQLSQLVSGCIDALAKAYIGGTR